MIGRMSEQSDRGGQTAPPGISEDMHPWSEAERPRGLDAYFAPGGEDDAPPERVADERRLTRLLVLMVVLLVGVPTLLTLIAFIAQVASLRSGA
jgi:hypothetical protein